MWRLFQMGPHTLWGPVFVIIPKGPGFVMYQTLHDLRRGVGLTPSTTWPCQYRMSPAVLECLCRDTRQKSLLTRYDETFMKLRDMRRLILCLLKDVGTSTESRAALVRYIQFLPTSGNVAILTQIFQEPPSVPNRPCAPLAHFI